MIKDGPKQRNGIDCGAYVCMFAEYLMSKKFELLELSSLEMRLRINNVLESSSELDSTFIDSKKRLRKKIFNELDEIDVKEIIIEEISMKQINF